VEDFSFTTHTLSPEALAYLCQALYQKEPEIYLLGIRGYKFSLGEQLSPRAEENFQRAFSFFIKLLKNVIKFGLSSAIIRNLETIKSRGKSYGKKQKRSSGA
jgi:hypothetical protein